MGIIKNIKERKIVKAKAIKEAEQIFIKKKTNAMADGSFPKVNGSNINTAYGREAIRTQKQVVGTRLKIMRAKRKAK